MTNTRNTPIEALEQRLPVRIERCTLRRGSGGAGAARGGDGIAKDWLFLAPARVSWIADRHGLGPWGLDGGGRGASGGARTSAPDRAARALASRASFALPALGRLHIETPGGGGFGRRANRRQHPTD
jgi:N-methylhydantoinase B